jgi:hypothetical protein
MPNMPTNNETRGNVIIRPADGPGWRVSFPRKKQPFNVVVLHQDDALKLAEMMRPDLTICLLDSTKVPEAPAGSANR